MAPLAIMSMVTADAELGCFAADLNGPIGFRSDLVGDHLAEAVLLCEFLVENANNLLCVVVVFGEG